ncbi:hypothetical protein MT997_26520 [Paenibacillus sp. OVF10]|nr:hypothetical protein MT997_26520 [Paenibacillus sp. OVF10]
MKKKLSILTAFAVFQAFAVIPANAQSADQSDTTSVNTAKVKSVEVVKKEQTIAESEVKSGTNTPTSNNETTEEENPETVVPTGTDATPVEPVIEPTDEEGTAEETPAPAPVEVEQPSTGGSSVAGGGVETSLFI